MKLAEVIQHLELRPRTVGEAESMTVTSVYCGDLLSDVLAHLEPDSIWFTVQGHVNVVAVADLRDAACVVVVNGVEPDPQTIAKAQTQGVAVCTSQRTSAELTMALAGKL